MCVFMFYVHALVLTSLLFFKQKTAYEMRISDWSSDVCSSDLAGGRTGWENAGPHHCAGQPGQGSRQPLLQAAQICGPAALYRCREPVRFPLCLRHAADDGAL